MPPPSPVNPQPKEKRPSNAPIDPLPSAERCAEEILDVIPAIMGSLRHEIRHDHANSITFMQFRVLSFLERRGTSSLSGVAEHLELGLPASSKILDGLVGAGFVERTTDQADRRRLLLELTTSGADALQATRLNGRKHLASILSPLSEEEQSDVTHSMNILRKLLADRPHRCASTK